MSKNVSMECSHPGCATPRMSLGRLFARSDDGGIPALFENRRVGWSFNTRVAIRAACDLIGLGPGDEVLAPAYNCGSELDPLLDVGLDVTLYPVARNLIVDPDDIAPLITDRTKAIYVTHYFGVLQPHLQALCGLCDDRGLRLIEDCALSLLSGATPADGAMGDVSVFCFYKFFPVLGGGALVVNAPDIPDPPGFERPPPQGAVARQLISDRLNVVLGQERVNMLKSWSGRLRGAEAKPADVPTPMSFPDMPAHYYFDPALRDRGMSIFASRPLRSFPVAETIAARHRTWRVYRDILEDADGVELLIPDLGNHTCPLGMPVLVESRDAIAAALQAQGIEATPWWAGFHRKLDWRGHRDAIWLKNHVLFLPGHQFLGPTDIRFIVDRLIQAVSVRSGAK